MKSNTSLSLCIFLFSLLFSSAFAITMALEEKSSTYMVYMHQAPEGADPKAFQLSALSRALGSEEAAKSSLIYHYSEVVSGFAAKLTPKQAEELHKLPEVTSVSPSQTYKLFNPGL